jgi:hypothetical protein
MSEGNIEVINVRPSPKPGQATVAYADVKIGGVTIRGFSIVKNKSGNGYFVGLPVRFGATGKAFQLIDMEETLRVIVAKLVLASAKDLLA